MLPLVLALLAQQPVTRADAVAAALTRGARVALGRTDTIAALGAARTARAFPNPTVAGSYTKDTPNYHLLGDLPLDLPWLRAPRIGAAEAARDAARSQFVFDRAGVVFDVDTTYTRALATALHARLSRRTADDADSLLKIAQLRRDVGDVSELDVRLAAVNAGQLQNAAIDDSLTALGTLLDLQLQMGLAGDTPTITLVDSLAAPEDSAPPPTEGAAVPGEYLPVAAAAARLRSAERTLSFTRASRFAPSVEFGFDTGDPASTRPSELLPVIGFSLPFPLFNRSGGEVTRAVAERDRARAELDLTRRETNAAVARARRELVAARSRARRSADLVASANRIAGMSLRAYGEGAVALANVLEAQRNAREILARYIDDLAAADAALRALRWLTMTAGQR
ncbi:MAG TPA: TolC family protein [Gemmatimonadales bacterium]